MKQRPTNLRKAAILVASLENSAADALLSEMTEAQQSAIRDEMYELGEIHPAEQEAVIEEFFRIGPLLPERQPAGIELDSRLAEKIGRQRQDQHSSHDTQYRHSSSSPFRFLHEATGVSLAARLQQEHPQTIAVVVSHLQPDRAADLLGSLPSNLQAEVARRLVDLEDTDPEVLYEIERGLESWLDEQERSSRRRTAGMVALQNILAAADPNTHEQVLANLARHDRRLASQIAPALGRIFTFADLYELNDTSLSKLLMHANQEVLTLALAGAGRALATRASRLLPVARAARLKRDLDQLGPTRVSDVEQAQQELANLATELDGQGQLPGSTGRKLSLSI